MRKIISAVLALILCMAVLPAVTMAAETDDSWIEERLRALEDQYNAGVMPMAFVEGHIPWDKYFAVSGLPARILDEEDIAANKTVAEKWQEDCAKLSEGYSVDNTGVKYTKFPQYLDKGIHFNNVTVNGVEVVRAGILIPDTGVGDPVYYYMTQKHVDSDSNDGSGSHTGSVSALVLPDGAKFQVNYAVNEYKLSYEIQLDGQVVTDKKSSVKDANGNAVTWEQAIFGGQNPASTNSGAASFAVTIPYGYTARVYQRLEEDGVLGAEEELTGPGVDGYQVNEGHPLGTEPDYVYDRDDNKGKPNSDGPSAMRMSAVFFSDLVTENRHIVVKLTTKKGAPVFDATIWKDINSSHGRMTTAHSYKDGGLNKPGGSLWPNILPEGEWGSWGTFENRVPMEEESGKDTYTIQWIFQTSSQNNLGYLLDALELNGVYVKLPFVPETVENGNSLKGIENGAKGTKKELNVTYTETVLPDGAIATIEFYRLFQYDRNSNQRVYILTITGARANVTVTYGNLFMYDGGKEEYVAESLVGVGVDENDATPRFQYFNGTSWVDEAMSHIQILGTGKTDFNNGDLENHYGANIRFRLYQGYENPVYSWSDRITGVMLETNGNSKGVIKENSIIQWKDVKENLDGNKLKTDYIYADEDGWYYIRLKQAPDRDDGYPMIILSIKATAMKYMVRYMVGEPRKDMTNGPADANVNESSMPTFDTNDSSWDNGLAEGISGQYPERYDDNGGNFYDRQTTPTIPVSDKTPTTKDGKKFFQYWVLVDNNEDVIEVNGKPLIVRPNETIDLSVFDAYAVSLASQIGGTDYNYYVIRLKGVWSDLPTDFKFYIRMVWTDAETGESHVMDLVQNVTTSSTDANLIDNDRLVVTVNTVTDVFKNWFMLHPFYAYAARNFIPTEERANDRFESGGIWWEKYPTEFTEGSTEQGIPDPTAYYRVVKDGEIIKYQVQRNGTIVLYLDPVNGRLPITKTVIGSDPGADEFTYTITAKLLPEDIERSKAPGADNFLTEESLRNMMASGTFFGMAPDATMNDLQNFTGKNVVLNFTRHADDDDLVNWYSTATFTLKGGEATVLGVPQGRYIIEESTKGAQPFVYDVTVNGRAVDDRTATQDVKVSATTSAVHFGNTVKPVDYTLKLRKEIVSLNDDGVPEKAQAADFEFGLQFVGGDSTQVRTGGLTANITTSGGMGEGSFETISFRHTGTYTFLVTETAYDKDAYFPSPRAHSVSVTVENLNGQLTVTKVTVDKQVYDGANVENAVVEFTNTYIGDIKGAFVLPEVTKVLKGRNALPAGMFTFELSADEQTGMTLPENRIATNGNGADGSVVFNPIVFEEAGEYTVTIREINDGKTGIDYDEGTVTITYTVEMGDSGLEVTKTEYAGGQGSNGDIFENQAYADASFDVEKVYNVNLRPGVKWDGDEFDVTATLVQAAGEVGFGGETLHLNDAATVTLTESAQTGTFHFRFYGEGSYLFEVKEVNSSIPGVTYDSSIFYVTVTVTADGEELTSAVSITKNGTPQKDTTITFYNSYGVKINVAVQAKKVLDGGELSDRQFSFTLVKDTSEDIDAVTSATQAASSNDANGNVTFTLSDLGVGTYKSIMREVNTGSRDITYDDAEYKVVITVKDVKGAPVATVEYFDANYKKLPEGEVPTFTNRLNRYGQLNVSNTVTGDGADQAKEFTFTFTFAETDEAFRYELQSDASANGLNGGVIAPLFAPGSTQTTGSIRSGESIRLRHGQSITIFGLPLGTEYTVKESDYDDYAVSHDGVAGNTAFGQVADMTRVPFVNKRISGTEAVPEVKKVVKGRSSIPAGMFEFVLAEGSNPNDGMTLPDNLTATNGADGRVAFDTITFNAAGEYTVTVTEKNGGKAGIDYDGKTITIIYQVENNDGDLKVTQTTYKDGVDTFENQAYADAGFDVVKNYDLSKRPGGGWEGDTFTVIAKLISASGEVKCNDATLQPGAETSLALTESAPNGRFDFRFCGEGIYTFKVWEADDGRPGVSYDTSAYDVTVTVTAVGEALAPAVSIAKDGKAVSGNAVAFDNRYDPDHVDVVVNASKVLQGAELTEGRFRFALLPEGAQAGGYVAANDAEGKISFVLQNLDAGTYAYTLSEINDGENGMVYDDAQYKVTVTVEVKPGDTAVSYTVAYARNDAAVDSPTFVNTVSSFGRLAVSKTVAGNAGETNRDFRFAATIGGSAYEFTLKHGEIWTSEPFAAGTEYTVTETDASADGYITTVPANAAGLIQGGQTVNVAFVNTKDSAEPTPETKTGSLTVRKQVTGNAGDPQAEFSFMVMLSDTSLSVTYGDMVFSNGVAAFTLRHGESKTASGLPAGIRYSVREQSANQDGYATTSTDESGTIVADTTVTAIFVNAKDVADVPQTGDDSRLALWMALAVMALIGMAVFGKDKGKKHF